MHIVTDSYHLVSRIRNIYAIVHLEIVHSVLFFLNCLERSTYTLVIHTTKMTSVLLKLLLDKKKLLCLTVRPKISIRVATVLEI